MRHIPEVVNESPQRLQSTSAGLTRSGTHATSSTFCGEALEENPWGYRKRLSFIVRAIEMAFPLRQSAGIRVLDVGCGNGSFVALPLARSGFDVTGLDFHQPSIDHARSMADAMPNARFITGTVCDITMPSFDVVILSEVLEHVVDPKALLLASLKHLNPDGIVVITVPNGFGEFEIDSWFFRAFRLQIVIDLLKRFLRADTSVQARDCQPQTAATDNDNCEHLQFFNRGRLKRLFQECSIDIVHESAGSFVCGPIICHTLARSRGFIEWNVRVVDKLPLALASSWYFVLRRATL